MSASILDLETISAPREQILANLPEWSEEEALTRKGNRTKPETISAFLEEDRANHGKDAIEKAALNPETATIAIVGFWKEGRVEQLAVAIGEGVSAKASGRTTYFFSTEAELIEHAFMRLSEGGGPTFENGIRGWAAGQQDPVLGWNLHGMDLKMLIRRAWILGVKVPKTIYNPLSRYPIPERFVDMMERYGVRRGEKFTSLNAVLKAMDLPEKGDGKEFGKLWQESRGAALEYNAKELHGQSHLYRRMGVDL